MKIKYLLLVLYVLVLTSFIFVVSTLSKYTSTVGPETSFTIGDQLYFNYTRGDLYRNDKLIVGVETSYKDGEENVPCIETMNVIPGDNITYNFYISNYDDTNTNNVDGEFYSVANGLLSLPIKQSTYDVECVIMYRVIEYGDEVISSQQFIGLSLDKKIDLPKAATTKVKYEFQVSVHLDEQISDTVSDDYFGATLYLNLYFNAVSK